MKLAIKVLKKRGGSNLSLSEISTTNYLSLKYYFFHKLKMCILIKNTDFT